MSDERIVTVMNSVPLITNMMGYHEIYGVLKHLQYVLENNIPGDIVEFGCFVGTTSIFIRKMLDEYKSDRQFHVYESWQGLPEKHAKDHSTDERQFIAGMFQVPKEQFLSVFQNFSLTLPIIHSGLFKDIPEGEYPKKIALVFMDGDFYTSTRDALDMVYEKVVNNGIILVDDCGWPPLPGPKLACEEFLEDKVEELALTGYPSEHFQFDGNYTGGKIVKGGGSVVLHSTAALQKLQPKQEAPQPMPFAPPPIQNTNISTLYKAGDNVLIYRKDADTWVKSTVVRFVEETSKYEVKYDTGDESYFELLQPGGDNHFPML
jgi:O-methyltransferase